VIKKNNMIKKLKYIFIGLFFLFYNCTGLNYESSLYLNENTQNLSKGQLKRLKDYFNGSFYNYLTEAKGVGSPMYFLINSKGDKSVLIACEDISSSSNCSVGVRLYQTINKYNKKFNDSFKILAKDNYILLGYKKYLIERKKIINLEKNLNLNIQNDNSKNEYFDVIIDKRSDPNDSGYL